MDVVLYRKTVLPFHSNGMVFTAYAKGTEVVSCKTYYSVGGGFVVDETAAGKDILVEDSRKVPYPFDSANQLLALCSEHNLSIPN